MESVDLQANTVTSKLMAMQTVTPFDSLIVAAGAQQSYFGNDHFATFAPGMKTIDDALELRGRILGAFEAAEVATDQHERDRRLTFVVVGGGPTGVELAGQIAELAEHTLPGAFRTIEPSDCRVILVDAGGAVLSPMGQKLGLKVQRRLEKIGVEIQLNSMVTNVDYLGITVKNRDGTERRIDCACKVWSAGVQANPLGRAIAAQAAGTETDRSGRVLVEPDLSIKGHPNVFVVGDLMAVPGVPGMAQGAIQGAKYVTKLIKQSLKGHDDPANRTPFKYHDKGSMATVSRHSAVAKMGKLEFGGYFAWLAWLVLHLVYLVGFKNRFMTLIAWFTSFTTHSRGQLAITSQMIYARLAMSMVQEPDQGFAHGNRTRGTGRKCDAGRRAAAWLAGRPLSPVEDAAASAPSTSSNWAESGSGVRSETGTAPDLRRRCRFESRPRYRLPPRPPTSPPTYSALRDFVPAPRRPAGAEDGSIPPAPIIPRWRCGGALRT